MKKTILVTGGAGFVGSSLALRFKQTFPKYEVIAFDNLFRKGSKLNLPRLKQGGVTFVKGDIRKPKDLNRLPKIHSIIDCCAEPSVMAGVDESPRYVIDTNLIGTVHALELAKRDNASFFFISTSRVYPTLPLQQLSLRETKTRFDLKKKQTLSGASLDGISEGFPITGTRTLYGATKLASEHLFTEYQTLYGIKGLVNRCGVIAGPQQMGKADQGILSFWIGSHYFGKPLSYIGFDGSGKQVRDFLHIEDLCDLLLLQFKNLSRFNGSVCNVGGGKKNSISLFELTQHCQNDFGLKVPIKKVKKKRQGDIPLFITDNRTIHSLTSWSPKRNLKTLFADTLQWIQENKKSLKPLFS